MGWLNNIYNPSTPSIWKIQGGNISCQPLSSFIFIDLVLLHLNEKLWKNQCLNTTDMTFSAHNKISQIIFDSTIQLKKCLQCILVYTWTFSRGNKYWLSIDLYWNCLFQNAYPISQAFLSPSASGHWQCCWGDKPLGCGILRDHQGGLGPLGVNFHTSSGIPATGDQWDLARGVEAIAPVLSPAKILNR